MFVASFKFKKKIHLFGSRKQGVRVDVRGKLSRSLFCQPCGSGDRAFIQSTWYQAIKGNKYLYLPVCVHLSVWGGQRHQIPLDLELQANEQYPKWALKTWLRSLAGAVRALNCCAIFPGSMAPEFCVTDRPWYNLVWTGNSVCSANLINFLHSFSFALSSLVGSAVDTATSLVSFAFRINPPPPHTHTNFL